ncbi:MAG: hypothetical protein ACXAEX_15650 [Promethearchaeota archaeon]|jgi:hypothetical protein
MPDYDRIIENYQSSDVTAEFFVFYKDEESSIDGVISLDQSLNKFITSLQGEIEYCWGAEYANMDEYLIFYIDLNEKNRLKEISDEIQYQSVRKLEEIFLVILHKEIRYRIIENLPPVFDWFMSYSF